MECMSSMLLSCANNPLMEKNNTKISLAISLFFCVVVIAFLFLCGTKVGQANFLDFDAT